MMTAAISLPCSAKMRSSAAVSFQRGHDQRAGDGRGHPARPRRGRRCGGRSPLARRRVARPVDRIRPAVVVALEAHDLLAAGEGAGKAQRVLHALGAGVAEPQELHRRHPRRDGGGRLALEVVGEREERAALAQGLGDRIDHGRVAVAEDQRPLAHHVVDVAVAVLVGQVRTLAAAHEHGHRQPSRPRRARPRPDAAGEARAGLLEELARPCRRASDVGVAHALASSAGRSCQAP